MVSAGFPGRHRYLPCRKKDSYYFSQMQSRVCDMKDLFDLKGVTWQISCDLKDLM